MRVNRAELLQQLESVQSGLSPDDASIQSNSFVFQKGMLMTFNGEMACRTTSPLGRHVNGAVQAPSLLAILGKITDDDVEVKETDSRVTIRSRNGLTWVNKDSEVNLEISEVETPEDGDWRDLPEGFCEALNKAGLCVAKNENRPEIMCVHIHPKFVEGFDNFQVCRVRIRTGVREPTLVKYSRVKNLESLAVRQIAETRNWLHFRTGHGLTVSCLRYVEKFPDTTPFLAEITDGRTVVLPEGLKQVCEKADTFSSENADNNQVTVTLGPGRIKVVGEGVSGGHKGWRKVAYDGPTITFMMAPELLSEIVEKYHGGVQINRDRLRAAGDRFVYVSSLGEVEHAGSSDKPETVGAG